jgi:hypothetical protein
MSYAQYGLIEASDYNGLVGTNPNTTSGKLNTVWSTGGNSAGYGQTALATVAVGQTVGAAEWANLTTTTTNIASHQGTSITSVTTPAVGDTVTYVAAIPTNLTTVYTNRLNAASQGSAGTNSAALGTSFDSNALFTLTASFANGDAARYFFNAGGQISFNCSPPANVSAPDAIFNGLASNVGTVFISAPNSGTANIAGNTFSGITKLGGGGLSAPTISTNSGYYGLSTSNTTVFTQISGDGGPYTNSSINFIAKTNGVQGSNSDNGNVITVYSTWAISPSGTPVSGGATTIITVRYPSSTYIANTWGTVATTASVVGSNTGVTTTTTTTTAAPTTTTTTTTTGPYSYVSEYGGELDATAGFGNPAGASVKVTITGGFTGTITSGIGSFTPDFTPQKWIDPTSAASGVYAGLYVRATGTYSLNVTGSVSSAELYGPGVTPVVQNVPGTASGSVTSSWVLLSTAAADPDGWVVAAQASSSGATAGGSWNMTVEIATDSGGTNVVASALFLFFGIGSSN